MIDSNTPFECSDSYYSGSHYEYCSANYIPLPDTSRQRALFRGWSFPEAECNGTSHRSPGPISPKTRSRSLTQVQPLRRGLPQYRTQKGLNPNAMDFEPRARTGPASQAGSSSHSEDPTRAEEVPLQKPSQTAIAVSEPLTASKEDQDLISTRDNETSTTSNPMTSPARTPPSPSDAEPQYIPLLQDDSNYPIYSPHRGIDIERGKGGISGQSRNQRRRPRRLSRDDRWDRIPGGRRETNSGVEGGRIPTRRRGRRGGRRTGRGWRNGDHWNPSFERERQYLGSHSGREKA